MAKRTSKGNVQRESILDAASALFIERGFPGTSMYDIADALGVTRTAVYYYFPNKEAILAALTEVVTRVAGQLAAQLAERKDLDPVDALHHLVVQHAKLILSHSLQFRVVERNENYLSPKRREAAAKWRHAVLDHFTEVIKRGIESGQLRLVDARIAAFAIIGMCNWTAWWYKATGRRSQAEICTLLAELAVNGLRQGGVRPPRTEMGESLRLLREELAYLEERIQDEPT
jgi:AcrR family transcriptional regulator